MATSVAKALAQGKLFTDHIHYRFLKLPISAASHVFQVLSSAAEKKNNVPVQKATYPKERNQQQPFQAVLVDKDEITVMVPQDEVDAFQLNKQSTDTTEVGTTFVYRLITFDIALDPSLIGFMKTVTTALAAANISVLPFAAYSRDHIFVNTHDFEKAMDVLEDLKTTSISSGSTLDE